MSDDDFDPQSERIPNRPHLSARVPESIARGVFATGTAVMSSTNELVMDFVQSLVQPHLLVSRVVMPWPTVPSLITALTTNLQGHSTRFEKPKPPVTEAAPAPTAAQEAVQESGAVAAGNQEQEQAPPEVKTQKLKATDYYDELKIDDTSLIGAYANGAIINHTEFEFKLDFLSTLHPHPVVVSRIFMSAPQVKRLLKSLQDNSQKRRGM